MSNIQKRLLNSTPQIRGNFSDHLGRIELKPKEYHYRFVWSASETRTEIFKDIEIHSIELNKFEAIEEENLDRIMLKVKDMLDRWIVVLTKYNLLNSKNLPSQINLPEIQKAIHMIQ